MKKKIFLIAAVMLMAVIICMTLVACDGLFGSNDNNNSDNNNQEIIGGGNDQNGSEDKDDIISGEFNINEFLQSFHDSDTKVIVADEIGINRKTRYELYLHKNIYKMVLDEEREDDARYCLEYVEHLGDQVGKYNCENGVWESGITSKGDLYFDGCETLNDFSNAIISEVLLGRDWSTLIEADYKLVDEWYETAIDFKYTSDVEMIHYVYKFKKVQSKVVGNIDFGNATMDLELVLGSDPIEIPQEAKDALEDENTVPDSISAFVLKWIDSNSKYMNVIKEAAYLKIYGNLCYTLASDFEFYSEIKGDVVVQWLKSLEEGSWNAAAQKYENKIDIVDAAWPGSISGFLDYDEHFEYKDGIYVGSGERFGDTIIEITAKKMTITKNGNVTCEMIIGGVEPFEIPDDVRNIYDGSILNDSSI